MCMLDEKSLRLRLLQLEFREFCSDFFSLSRIRKLFQHFQLSLPEEESLTISVKRDLVDSFYQSVDWNNQGKVKDFLRMLDYIEQLHDLPNVERERLTELRQNIGLQIEDSVQSAKATSQDLFISQFPAGLPFGKPKPDFVISAKSGSQTLKYELKNELGILNGEIYPDFSFRMLESLFSVTPETNLVLKKALVAMNQTDLEKEFFKQYAKYFNMANEHVPVLIPQAWIQWHSQSKKNLRAINSSHADEPYRVDFVAFWNNKRYVILVDDIGHYAVKSDSKWLADQESYSKRLKEDRKLRRESWQVFRVSNWELRDDAILQEILEDFRSFVGF
jgi:hypothetical protein